MRPAKVSVAKAEAYYYDRDACFRQSESRYLGTGAAALGIEGKVVKEEFSLLIRGFSPTGEKLAQRKDLEDNKAIAGTDIPLTLPKSWSVLALIDPDLRKAALDAAKAIVAQVEANGWVEGRQTHNGITERVAGKMAAAVFPHSSSRENDAHFHIHAVFLNMAQRPDATWSTVENYSLLQHSKEIRQLFLSEFAASKAARKYGMELSVDRGGTVIPEAAGMREEVKELFSKRHRDIESADSLRERLREKMPHLGSEALETLVQLGTRSAKNKEMTEADLLRNHREQLRAAGLPSLEELKESAITLKTVQEQNQEKLTARQYITQAAEDLSERQSVFSRQDLLQAALKQSIGQQSPAKLEKAILECAVRSEIISYGQDKFTTPEIHKIEGQVATVAVQQRNAFAPLLPDDRVNEAIGRFEGKKGFSLTHGQAEAVGYVLQHTGRIGVIQGDAGAGKSSSMEAVADTIKVIGKETGVQVRGFALQGKTSVLLEGESGISSGTIDSFLASKSTWDGTSRQLWVVDEYSMVDSRRMGALVARAEQENAQVVLLGDHKQLAAISAGRLGQDLYEHGLIHTVQMNESLRQKTEYAKAIDAAMKRGDVRTALEVMERAGKLHVIEDREERTSAMAKAFVTADREAREATGGRKGALAMTLTNAERRAVIDNVRQLQKDAGVIAQEDHCFTTRAPVQLDAVTRKLAASYQAGMVAIPAKAIGSLEAGKETRVTGIDSVRNTITLSGADGTSETIDARKQSSGLMLYEEKQILLSEGEKIVWQKSDNTAQGKHNRIKNGLSGTIEKIDGERLTVKTELGHTVQISGEGAYITNAQAITGHKAQGATEHTGILSISADDRLATRNMLYVLTTRQTDDLIAFVDDKEKLIEALRDENKSSSLEEQRGLLKSLTEQLKQTVEREEQLAERFKAVGDVFERKNENTTDQQRRTEVENQMVVNDRHTERHTETRDQNQVSSLSL